jgi:hypothetical protein
VRSDDVVSEGILSELHSQDPYGEIFFIYFKVLQVIVLFICKKNSSSDNFKFWLSIVRTGTGTLGLNFNSQSL